MQFTEQKQIPGLFMLFDFEKKPFCYYPLDDFISNTGFRFEKIELKILTII